MIILCCTREHVQHSWYESLALSLCADAEPGMPRQALGACAITASGWIISIICRDDSLTLSCGMMGVLLAALVRADVGAGLAPAPVGAPPGLRKGV